MSGLPPASSPAPKQQQQQQQQGPNPKRNHRAPAPVYPETYKPEDYDEHGKLKVLRKVPIGEYPVLHDELLSDRTSSRDLTAPPAPIAPPRAREDTTIQAQAATALVGQRAAAKSAGEVLLGDGAEKKEIDIEDAPLVHQTLVKKGPNPKGGRVEMHPLPEPRRQPENPQKYDPNDPVEFLDSEKHHLFTLSWVANRHPQESAIMEHRVQQLLAEREGRYNAQEDPPVNLDEIVPTVLIRVARSWSQRECEYRNGENVANFAKKLNAVTSMGVINWPCGKGLVLPISDSTKGIFSDATQQQQMDAFYDNQKQSADDILARIKKDKETAEAAHQASLEATAALNAMPKPVAVATAAPSLADGTIVEEEEEEPAIKEKPSWASIAAAVSSLPDPAPASSAPIPALKQQPKKVTKRAGVRRPGPTKRPPPK